MKLHLLGLPHTVTNPEYSHCAFTSKVLKFPSVMQGRYEIIHYGVAGAYFGRIQGSRLEHVDVMSREKQVDLLGHDSSDLTKFYGDDTNVDSPLYIEFNKQLRKALAKRVVMEDLVLFPFGHAHDRALDGFSYNVVESGIGYKTLSPLSRFKVFESYAWMHYHQGKANRFGHNYEWVVPNYFDVDDWEVQKTVGPLAPVVFLGRIGPDKGLPTIVELAKCRPDLLFLICGQGDPKPYLVSPNIQYLSPITGRTRSEYLGNARAVLMPSTFTEPFGGVAVEAMMCGTPVISSSFGAFTETIEDGVTGLRCHTLGDYLDALDRVVDLDRSYIAKRARRLYGFERVGKMYDRVFRQIADLSEAGWYTKRSGFEHGS